MGKLYTYLNFVCVCSVPKLCPALCNSMDCTPSGSSIHAIFQARVLEWGAIAFSEIIGSKFQRLKKKCRSFINDIVQYEASLIALLVKNPPVMQETPVRFLGPEDPWRRDRLPMPVFLGFPCGSAGKELACNAGDLG